MVARKKSPLSKWAAKTAAPVDWSKVDPAKIVQKEPGEREPEGQRDMFAGYRKIEFGPKPAKQEYEKTENKSLAAAHERVTAESEEKAERNLDEMSGKVGVHNNAAFAHQDAMLAANRKGDKQMALYHARQAFREHIAAHNAAVDRYGKDSNTAKDHAAEAERMSRNIGKLGGDSPGFDASKHPRDEKGRFT